MTLTEPVEIKITVGEGGPVVEDAIRTLGLGRGARRRIWFLEDLTPGLSEPFPLLKAGIILRLRLDGDTEADSTVKLRPARRSQLARPWTEAASGKGWEYKIEGDWAGPRHTLAASCTADLTPDRLAHAIGTGLDDGEEPGPRVPVAFTARQEQFLESCADLRVALGGLTPLGPVDAIRWKKVKLSGFDAVAERWTLGPLDFLELSIRVEPGTPDPERRQVSFESVVRAAGLKFAVVENKTTRMLAELAQHHACAVFEHS